MRRTNKGRFRRRRGKRHRRPAFDSLGTFVTVCAAKVCYLTFEAAGPILGRGEGRERRPVAVTMETASAPAPRTGAGGTKRRCRLVQFARALRACLRATCARAQGVGVIECLESPTRPVVARCAASSLAADRPPWWRRGSRSWSAGSIECDPPDTRPRSAEVDWFLFGFELVSRRCRLVVRGRRCARGLRRYFSPAASYGRGEAEGQGSGEELKREAVSASQGQRKAVVRGGQKLAANQQ